MNKKLYSLIMLFLLNLLAIMPAQAMLVRAGRMFGRYVPLVRTLAANALESSSRGARAGRAPKSLPFNWQSTVKVPAGKAFARRYSGRAGGAHASNSSSLKPAKKLLIGAAGVVGVGVLTYDWYAHRFDRLKDIIERGALGEMERWFYNYGTVGFSSDIVKYCLSDLSRINPTILHKIVKKYPNAVREIKPLAIEHFDILVETSDGLELLRNLIWLTSTDEAARFTSLAVEHFDTLIETGDGPSLLCALIERASADEAARFTSLVVEHFDTLIEKYYGREFLLAVMRINPNTMKEFILKALDNPVSDGQQQFMKEVYEIYPDEFNRLMAQEGIPSDMNLLIEIQEKKDKGESLSQSEVHMLVNRQSIARSFVWGELQQLQRTVLLKEQELANAGYAIFYHAQSSEKWLPIDLDAFLYEMAMGKPVDDFYFMHTKYDEARLLAGQRVAGLANDNPLLNSALKEISYGYCLENEVQERARIVCSGRERDADRNRMLFLNDSLRGNTLSSGSQSFPHYFVENRNVGNVYSQGLGIVKDLFKMHNFENFYSEFAQELQQLYAEYKELSRYGTLYQIAVPVDKVAQMIIPVTSGGYKTTSRIDGNTTSDMSVIVPALRNPENYPVPSDEKEYVAIMTHDENGLMNPACGAKIKAYMISSDEDAYQEWQRKWTDLKARIKARIESQRSDDYVAPAHAQELVNLWKDGLELGRIRSYVLRKYGKQIL